MEARNIHAGLPITDDDAAIAAALEDVSIPTLVLSLVHITGDPSWIRSELRPHGLFLNEVQGFMSEEAKAQVRKLALEVICKYRDGGSRLPPPPSPALIREMMSWLVCADVPEEYVPMLLEEMELEGRDERAFDWHEVPEAARADFPVVVIGCGQSGLLAGLRLKEAGIPFTILEKYISGCLQALISGGHRAMEPTQAAHDDYYARTHKELEGLVWSHPSIEHSWYKNAEGKIHILSPWRLVDYWAWTKAPELRDFEFS